MFVVLPRAMVKSKQFQQNRVSRNRVWLTLWHEDNARNFGFEFCLDMTRVDEARCSARIAMTFGFDWVAVRVPYLYHLWESDLCCCVPNFLWHRTVESRRPVARIAWIIGAWRAILPFPSPWNNAVIRRCWWKRSANGDVESKDPVLAEMFEFLRRQS